MDGGRRILRKTGYPRRRAVAACSTCRERKRKWYDFSKLRSLITLQIRCIQASWNTGLTEISTCSDNLRPACSSCQQIGVQCEYIKQDASSFDAASLTILDQLSVIEGLVRDIHPSSTLNASSPPASSSRQRQPTLSASIRPFEDNKSSGVERVVFTLSLDANRRVATDKILQWPIFDNLLSPLRQFRYIDFHGSEVITYLDDFLIQSDASTSRSLLESSWDLSAPVNISTERPDIERLVDLFFKRNNIKNPILSRPVVSQYCQQYYEHGPLFNLETCLVLLTCAIGALSTEFDPLGVDESPRSPSHSSARLASLRLGQCYFVAAEKRLGAAISTVNTLAIQCLCLAG